MQSFEHFDALFMIDKSIERGKLFLIFPSLFMSMLVEDSRKIALARKRKTNCAIITSFPWSALDQSEREKSLSCSYSKKTIKYSQTEQHHQPCFQRCCFGSFPTHYALVLSHKLMTPQCLLDMGILM